ncbi:MAG: hypothetical protein MI743_21735 [Sneathiellales bacterium]|nr:hypothetical protein [Sneathiellales bacterium]
MDFIFIAGLFVSVVLLYATVKLASSRGRSQAFWALLVLMLPPAFLVLLFLPHQIKHLSNVRNNNALEDGEFFKRCTNCNKLYDASQSSCTICGF